MEIEVHEEVKEDFKCGLGLKNGHFDESHSTSKKRSAADAEHDDAEVSLFPPLRKRVPNHVCEERAIALPRNWIRQVITRKNGIMANRSIDVRYISPSGEVFERKSQLVKLGFDLDGFDFKSGKVNEALKRWIKLKPQFYPDLPPEEALCDPELDPPIRQTASIFKQPVSLVKPTSSQVKSEATEGSRDKPKQVFWHKRLEGLQSAKEDMELPSKIRLLDPSIFDSEGVNSTLRLLASSLHTKSGPVVGQSLRRDETENLDPTVFSNPDQPLVEGVSVNEDDIVTQETKLREARSRLADALTTHQRSSF